MAISEDLFRRFRVLFAVMESASKHRAGLMGWDGTGDVSGGDRTACIALVGLTTSVAMSFTSSINRQ